MIYYHHEQKEKMLSNPCNKKLDAVLQKNFPENDKLGACIIFDERGFADTIEINKLSEVTQKGATWTHYATIGIYKSYQESEDEYWEVYSQFNGKNEDELWIFAYYNKFGEAVRRVKLGIEKLKPIKQYLAKEMAKS